MLVVGPLLRLVEQLGQRVHGAAAYFFHGRLELAPLLALEHELVARGVDPPAGPFHAGDDRGSPLAPVAAEIGKGPHRVDLRGWEPLRDFLREAAPAQTDAGRFGRPVQADSAAHRST